MRTFHLRVRSKNYSCAPLRELEFNKRVIFRMGSVTPTDKITKRKDYLEINSAEGCAISSNKIKMKERFTHGKIPTAMWFRLNPGDIHYLSNEKIYFSSKINHLLSQKQKVIIKHKYSSKGNGIYLISSQEDFNDFYINVINKDKKELSNYIFEKYYTYSREYRIHVSKNGCFLADRKMLLNDAKVRWHRHADNSIWIHEDNPLFDKPTNWGQIVKWCIYAMKSLGLDICSFDVKVQNNKHKDPLFIIMESNSAPGLSDWSIEKYKNELTKIINE